MHVLLINDLELLTWSLPLTLTVTLIRPFSSSARMKSLCPWVE